MKYGKVNPKAEGRGPKEGRCPKAESYRNGEQEFCAWGENLNHESMVVRESPPTTGKPRLNLAEKTARFGEAIIQFAKKIPRNPVNDRLIGQLVGAGTSIGANFCEADDAVSGKEFKQKIGFCRKESKETMFFLRMSATAEPSLTDEARKLWCEGKELNLIFGSIWRK